MDIYKVLSQRECSISRYVGFDAYLCFILGKMKFSYKNRRKIWKDVEYYGGWIEEEKLKFIRLEKQTKA